MHYSLVFAIDLFRYAANGLRSYTYTATTAYFSIDNGLTNLVNFNNDIIGADVGDWAGGGSISRVMPNDFEYNFKNYCLNN
jgi:hypothetical protein